MHNDQSSLSSTRNLSGKMSRSCSRSPSRSQSWSYSCLSSRSYSNHHVAQDDCKPSALPKHKYLYSSKSDDGRRIHCPDKSDTVFATFSAPMAKRDKLVGNLPKGYIRNVPLPRVPREQSTRQSRVLPDRIPHYSEDTYMIPTYKGTCRIGERIAKANSPPWQPIAINT
jgi:hypothetical protein